MKKVTVTYFLFNPPADTDERGHIPLEIQNPSDTTLILVLDGVVSHIFPLNGSGSKDFAVRVGDEINSYQSVVVQTNAHAFFIFGQKARNAVRTAFLPVAAAMVALIHDWYDANLDMEFFYQHQTLRHELIEQYGHLEE